MSEPTIRWWTACTVIALSAAVLVAPLPSLAAETPALTPAPATSTIKPSADRSALTYALATSAIRDSAERAAKAYAPAMRAESRAAQAPAGTAGKDKWSFFKSPVGAVVAVLLSVGVGYALYSTAHDRVHSPGKQ